MTYTTEFEAFWSLYPKRWNRSSGKYYKVGKWEAFQVWKRLSQKDRSKILIIVKFMRTGEFVLDAHRWLKKRRFDDLELPEPKRKPVVSEIKTISPEEIAERAKKGKKWKAEYDKRKKRLFKTPKELISVNVNNERNKQMEALAGSIGEAER